MQANKVSLWLGNFEKQEDFRNYINGSYDEDGNYIASEFEKGLGIKRHDCDAVESDWIVERCAEVESLLAGFSGDSEMIPQFKKMLEGRAVENYNSIILLYHFEYTGAMDTDTKLEYIGCADVTV